MAAQPDVLEGEVTALAIPEQHSALVLPAVDAAGMKRAMAAYTAICKAVLEPTDYQKVNVKVKQRDGSYQWESKTFKKRSAWQKLATAFSVSTEIVDKVVHLDDDGRVLRAEFVVRATAPNGRHEDGYGAASRGERDFSKPDHDIPATAETRARNRACANLFAFGELTAEEIDGGAPETRNLPPKGQEVAPTHSPAQAASPPTDAPAPVGKNLVRYRSKAAAGEGAAANPSSPSASPSEDEGKGGSTASSASSPALALRDLVLRRAVEVKRAQNEKSGEKATEQHLRIAAAESIARVFEKPLVDMDEAELKDAAERLAEFLSAMDREVPK